MNIKHLIATVAVLSATSSVFAQQTEWVDPAAQFVSTKTQAEVIAEVKQAYAEGSLVTNDAYPTQLKSSGASLTSAEVRSKIAKSVKLHKGDTNDLYFGS